MQYMYMYIWFMYIHVQFHVYVHVCGTKMGLRVTQLREGGGLVRHVSIPPPPSQSQPDLEGHAVFGRLLLKLTSP